jgi:anti-anti-sigma regulatory factor
MNFKIDTKEKFNEITILDPYLPANMTDNIAGMFSRYLQNDVKNIVLSLGQVNSIELEAAKAIASIQQTFYENQASFVICGLQPQVEKFLDDHELLEQMNTTPSLSEAWDIVQMEEIERELLDNF